jgi:hypothetical protein
LIEYQFGAACFFIAAIAVVASAKALPLYEPADAATIDSLYSIRNTLS